MSRYLCKTIRNVWGIWLCWGDYRCKLQLVQVRKDCYSKFWHELLLSQLSVIDDIKNAKDIANSFPWVDGFGQVQTSKEDRSSFELNIQQWTPFQSTKVAPVSAITCILRDSPKWKNSGKPKVETNGIVHIYGHLTGTVCPPSNQTVGEREKSNNVLGFTVDLEKVDFLARPQKSLDSPASDAKSKHSLSWFALHRLTNKSAATPVKRKLRYNYDADSPSNGRATKRPRTRGRSNIVDLESASQELESGESSQSTQAGL